MYHNWIAHYNKNDPVPMNKPQPTAAELRASAAELRALAVTPRDAARRTASVSIDDMPLPPPQSPVAGAHVDYDDLPPPPGGLVTEHDPDGPLPSLPPSTPPGTRKNMDTKGGKRSRRGKQQIQLMRTKRKTIGYRNKNRRGSKQKTRRDKRVGRKHRQTRR
jgi:hypothetical protein